MVMQQNAFIACYTDRSYRVVKKGDEAKLRKGGKTLTKLGILHVQPPSTNANLVIVADVDQIALTCTDDEMVTHEALFPPGSSDNLREAVYNTEDGVQSSANLGAKANTVGGGMVFSMPNEYDDTQRGLDADAKLGEIRLGPNLDLTNPVDGTF